MPNDWGSWQTRDNGNWGQVLNPGTNAWEDLGATTTTGSDGTEFGGSTGINSGVMPKSLWKSGGGAYDSWQNVKGPDYKPGFMDQYAWALPFVAMAGAGAAGGAFSGAGAATGMDAIGSGAGVWNTLGEGAYGATGLGGIEAAAPAAFDWGGPTGADELLGTGGDIASGGSAGWTGAMGAEDLLGTGGAEVAGSSAPGWGTSFRAAMQSPVSALQRLMQGGGGDSGGGSNWGGPLSLMSAASGLYGLSLADKQRKLAQMSITQSDPFAASRPQYVDRLNALMSNPSSITSTPGYEAGLQAVERKMASQGFNGSGNMMTALSKYGGDFYNQEVQRLMQLSGANATPGAGIATAGSINNNANSLASSSLASLGYGGRGATAPPTSPVIAAFLRSVGLS